MLIGKRGSDGSEQGLELAKAALKTGLEIRTLSFSFQPDIPSAVLT